MGSKDKSSHAWLMLTKETRQHSGNLGYDDSSAEHYSWDNTVPNHLKPKVHDKIVIWDGKTLIGASVIQNIIVDVGEKIRLRCPFCSATDFHERYKILPRYRCRTQSCKNEFDNPDKEIIAVTTFKSYHSKSWCNLEGQLDSSELRSICIQTKSQHSLRLLDWQKFLKLIGEGFSHGLNNISFLKESATSEKTKNTKIRSDQSSMTEKWSGETLKTFHEDLMGECASVALNKGDTTLAEEFLELQLNQLTRNEKASEFQVVKREMGNKVKLTLSAIRRDQVPDVSFVFQLFSDETYEKLKILSKTEITKFKQKALKFIKDCVNKLPQEISDINTDLFKVAAEIKENWSTYRTINILILTNRPAEANNFKFKDEEQSKEFNIRVYDLKTFYMDQEKCDQDRVGSTPMITSAQPPDIEATTVLSVKNKPKEISVMSKKETKKIIERRNVKWSREEIIITLDFYFKEYPKLPDKTSKKVKTLSDLLRKRKLKTDSEINSTYRNAAGIYMKLMNFNNINPEHLGKGLNAGSKLDQEIFREFKNNKESLSKLVKQLLDHEENKAGVKVKEVEKKDQVVIKTCSNCNKEYQEYFTCPSCGAKTFYLGSSPLGVQISKSKKTTILGQIISWFKS